MNIVTKAILITLVGIAFMKGAPARAELPECRGDKRECVALIQPEVHVIELRSSMELESICGRGAKGCAQIHAGFQTCTVYISTRAKKSTRTHEMNHCRGWNHKGDGHRNHRKPWVPFAAVEQWLLKSE